MDEQAVMRVPPNNADAERSVLSCMMQDREALTLAFELLTAEDFYQPAHREIFDAMHALSTQGMPADLVTVDDELTRRGTLEGVGGSSYLVAGKAIRISARGAEGGRLYGSVTSQEIAAALEKQYGVKVEKRRIEVANIRNAGDFTVSVWLYAGVTAEMTAKVEVIKG